MSRNGTGTYNLPAGNPVVTGTTISSTWANNTLGDIQTALTGSVASDGQTPITGNLQMGANRITGLADGLASTDAATVGQLPVVPSLGTMATQNANAVAVTGGAIDGTTVGSTTRSTVKATTLDLGLSTQSVAIGQGNASIMKNRIINGAMVIDQRNAGASVTITTAEEFITDRWQFAPSASSKLTAQQSSTAPAGFSNSLLLTSSAATSVGSGDYYFLGQKIEGFNFADCGWGTADAKTVTLSFWCRSSITGTYGGALVNSAQNRSYPFSYTISSANTWEQKTITVTGDTTGTWIGATNGVGVRLRLGFGIGSTYSGTAGAWAAGNYMSVTGATNWISTSGATFYITGVQLEVGSSATGFEYRQYGQELALCQRYYNNYGVATTTWFISSTVAYGAATFPPMRTAPTVVGVSGTQQYGPGGQLSATVAGYGSTGTTYTGLSFTQSGGGTTNAGGLAWGNITLSSEL